MSPEEREEVAKIKLTSSTSINNADNSRRSSEESANGERSAREVRNKYLSRIGVGNDDHGSGSDNEPLLH